MDTCPKCNAHREENFDICWKCQYCFSEDREIKNTNVSEVTNEIGLGPTKLTHLKCLRCEETMVNQGTFKFHEGNRVGVFGNVFELFVNQESFALYVCPNCGKVEFYLPTI